MIGLFASAQEVADTMYIYGTDKTIERIAVECIDSVTFTPPKSAVSPEFPPLTGNYEAVDLGLSVMWAAYNVGATRPEEYGGYYAWGEVEEKENYSWSTYKWSAGCSTTIKKYSADSFYGVRDNNNLLDPTDDVARVKWGGKWRMPTTGEQRELVDNCTWLWTTLNGVYGYRVTSKINGNSIFLPAAGARDGAEVVYQGCGGCYWSGTLCGDCSDTAYFLCTYDVCYDWVNFYRYIGFCVRPVTK